MSLKRTATKKDVVNLALALIGESPIDDLESTTDAAAISAKELIDQVIIETQADFPYQELRKAVAPELDADFEQAVSDAYAYRFVLPDDFICPARDVRGAVVTDDAGNELRHYFEGNYLYSTQESVHLNYIRESNYPAEWWPYLTQAVYHKLAVMLAPARNKSATLMERLINLYEKIVRPRIRKQASSKRSSERPVRRQINRYHDAGRRGV